MKRNEKAMMLFDQGCNCSQAVLMAYVDVFDLDVSTMERVSVAFGGGMSKQGKTCGCMTGALMILGLKYGIDSTTIISNRILSYNKGKEFIQIFHATFGETECKQLIKLDLNKKEDLEEASKNVFGSRCKQMVGKTVELLDEFLGNDEKL